MAWWNRRAQAIHDIEVMRGTPSVLTAAAAAIRRGAESVVTLPKYETWQTEVWHWYDELGEFRYGVDWLANALSRCQLKAARFAPGQDEPEVVDSGIAVDLIAELVASESAQFMKRLGLLFSVPGECYLLGERYTSGGRPTWTIRSLDEVRELGSQRLQVIDWQESRNRQEVWRDLAPDSFIARLWRPHPRYRYLADTPARPARPILRELDLVNRHIQATYYSRLASAGLVLFPDEVTFPVAPEYEDAPDPFVASWIATAREAIKTPGTAAATVPIPIRMPGEYVDKVRFIDFTTKLDEQIIEKRDSAIKRLATELDLPSEVLLGIGQVNHWGQWQLEESAIKMHISPIAELICESLTLSYLRPRLLAAQEDPTDWVVWYDPSNLVLRPDRSTNAAAAYANLEISGSAYRREVGFTEDDAPSDDELESMILRVLAKNPQVGMTALNMLTGAGPAVTGIAAPYAAPPPTVVPQRPEKSPPPGPPTEEQAPQAAALIPIRPMTTQLVARHLVAIDLGHWHVLHPATCQGSKQRSCPVTWAAFNAPNIAPGTSGRYRLRLRGGQLELGERVLDGVDGVPVSTYVK